MNCPAPLIATLQTIERYHFQYTMVSQLSSSGGVSEMYAKAARELYRSTSNQERALTLREIREKLVDRAPSREQFISDFIERFLLTNEFTRDNRLVGYVLRGFLRVLHPATGLDNLTVEHILPQDQIGRDGIDAKTVGSIGNLLVVSEALNTKLDNKPFSRKVQVLASDGTPYDIGGVTNQTTWGPAEINARAQYLAELAYDRVWKLPV